MLTNSLAYSASGGIQRSTSYFLGSRLQECDDVLGFPARSSVLYMNQEDHLFTWIANRDTAASFGQNTRTIQHVSGCGFTNFSFCPFCY